MNYTGTIVEESLIDNRYLNNLSIIGVRISSTDIAADRWHMYKVTITEDQIKDLANQLKPEQWYMHFWNGDDVIAVFPGKVFRFNYSDKTSWSDAVNYGKSINIPEEQLDFLINEE